MRWLIGAVVLCCGVAAAFWLKGCLDLDRCLDSGGRLTMSKGFASDECKASSHNAG